MEDSMHNIRYSGWSTFGNDAFGEIAMCMDTTSTVRLAACSKELHRQVTNGKASRCPNHGCGTLVAFHDFLNHKMVFPHGPCNYTDEPGCELAAPPTALLAHLKKSHSMEVHSFHYGKEHKYISRPLLAPGSWRVETIVSRDDGTEFAVRLDMLDYGLVVSVQCVRYISQPLSTPLSSRLENIGSEDDGTVFTVLFYMHDSGDIIVSIVCVRPDGFSSPLYNMQFTVYHPSTEPGFWEGGMRNSFTPRSKVVPDIIHKEKHSMLVYHETSQITTRGPHYSICIHGEGEFPIDHSATSEFFIPLSLDMTDFRVLEVGF